MAKKLMYIPIDNTQNFTFCRLKLVVEMYKKLIRKCNVAENAINTLCEAAQGSKGIRQWPRN